MKYELNKKYNYYIRPEPYQAMDLYTLREVKSNYKSLYPLLKDKVVLDVGAHIGAFSRYALDYGASAVVAYEPVKENYDVLKYNLGELVDCRKAGIALEDGREYLYMSTGTCTTTHSMMPVKSSKRKRVRMVTRSFTKILDEIRPEVIKWDAEGAELFVIDELCNLPDYVKIICIEISCYPVVRKRIGMPDSEIKRLCDGLTSQFKTLTVYPPAANCFDDPKHNEGLFIGIRD